MSKEVMMVVRRLEIPVVLRRAWGDEAADAFAAWLTSVLEERAISRDEYRQILSRLDILEHDIADLKADVRELRKEMNERFDRMYHQMVVQTRWFIGALVVIGTVISTLLAIGQFVR
jgi:uncharacterized protein (UPF0335 family)